MIQRQPDPALERGFIAAVLAQGVDSEDELAELRELARTALVKPVGAIVQHRPRPQRRTYLGKGKLEELKRTYKESGAEVLLVDDELDPAQQRTLEDALQARVVDRTQLILDIFAQHATSAEGKLQVELAQLEYNLPRMRGMWQHLERLGGGVGTRGPGESQLETDRRIARRRITLLRRRLRELSKQRDVRRKRRRRAETPTVALVRGLVPGEPLYDDGEVLLYGDAGAPVVLAGHLDTVPAQANLPGRIDGAAVHGLGASDMKGGVAVMIELARAGVPGRYLFFTREEVALAESPLPALFATGLLADARLAVVLEPTDNQLHAGRVGNLQALVTFHGESAHSARPWTGVNAIHELVRGLEPLVRLEPLDVELDGLVFREVVSAVRVEGGIAPNVVPASASVDLNFRYAPGRSRDDAEARLRSLVPHGEIEILANSPSAPPAVANPLARRLVELGRLEIAPKQAWTPVAQFAEQGIDAVNFGPGATAYAHKRDEQVPVENLERCLETLRAFLLDTV